MEKEQALLSIQDLSVDLMTVRGVVHALRGVNLDVLPGEIHGLVGESGCGKSMTAKTVLRLIKRERCRIGGQVFFDASPLAGNASGLAEQRLLNLLDLSSARMQEIRGARISMIFQDPSASLDPLFPIGDQIAESFRQHEKCTKKEARQKTLELLERVGIQPADKRYRQYPHELSGGLQQRVMIAIAAACHPALLIADEPTTALDVTIQAQILELLRSLSREMGMSILLITHNFGIVAEVCDRVSVMYAGKIVETGDTRTVFAHARHPYTQALLKSIPRAGTGEEYLPTIPGTPPALFEKPVGCAFADRCPKAGEECRVQPQEETVEPGHMAACWKSRKDQQEPSA